MRTSATRLFVDPFDIFMGGFVLFPDAGVEDDRRVKRGGGKLLEIARQREG